MKLEIIENFHVWVGARPATKVDYTRGMVVDEKDVPADQSAQDWIDKGLAKAVKAAGAGTAKPAQEAGAAV